MIHRAVMDCGQDTIRRLQALDDTGYSGHIAYILQMLDAPAFRSVYLAGDFQPAAVQAFGRTHGIVINRIMSEQS